MKHKQTLRRGLGILFGLVLCLTLLTVSALAAEGDVDYRYYDETETKWVTGTKAAGEYTVVTNSTDIWGADGEGEHWYVVTGDVTIGTEASPEVVGLKGDVHLILKDNCSLTVHGIIQDVGSPAGNLTVYAQSDGDEQGSMAVYAPDYNESFYGSRCAGICVWKDFTVHGGSVTARGAAEGNTNDRNYGISGESFTVFGGTVTATGGTADCEHESYGIYASNAVTISGGTVNATGGKVGGDSYGIYAYKGDVTISGSADVTAMGGQAGDQWNSFGIHAKEGNVTISGGTVRATGGAAMRSCGIFASKGNVTISGGTVTATGGAEADASYGIYASNTVTISGSANVTATGGAESWMSCGIDASMGDVTISGSANVTATGGAASWMSCGIFVSAPDDSETDTGGSIAISDDAVVAATGGAVTSEYSSGESYGIYAVKKAVTISGSANVTAKSGTVTGDSGNSCGIHASGKNVIISGGSVKATGDAAADSSYGIFVGSGSITISGDTTTVTAKSGKVTGYDRNSCGIYANGGIAVSGGKVDAIGGESTNDYSVSYGIYSEADIAVSGGSVTATGGDATGECGMSCGISTDLSADGVTISGEDTVVTATGGTVTCEFGGESYGIFAPVLKINGGTVTAIGGDATGESGTSYGICSHYGVAINCVSVTATGGEAGRSHGICSYESVAISGGSVTATGDTAEWNSYGIYASKSVTIKSGTGTVTATSGAVTGEDAESCGIYADDGVTIKGGHVIARTPAGENGKALNVQPDLSGYTVGENTVYYWRTSTAAPFTASTKTPYPNDTAPTYAEFSNGCTYTITLDPNYEGGQPSTVVTGTDGKLSELPAPTRDGYNFEGWFTESGTAAVTTATVFAQDTDLYAHWTYGFKFKINGQDVTADNIDSFTTTGSISYDATTKTLTLENATIAGTALDENTTSILNCGDAVKTIVLVGENVINGSVAVTEPGHSYNYYYYGIGTEKSLTIQGSSRDDSLTITLPAWTCKDNIAYYDKVTRGISVGASGSTDKLTIQNCTLDVVCAGATNQSSDVYAIYADCMIQIDNAKVNAFAGKNRDGSITETRKGIAICASGRTLEISDSDITAGAFSNRTSDKVPQDFAALEGGSIKLTGCTLDLAAEAPNAVLPVSALHTTYAYNDVVNITNCEGTLHGSKYGIHIDPSSGATIAAYPVFTKSDLTITAFRGESDPGNAVKITGYDSTSGFNPQFNDVIVKAGANESTATLYSNPNSSSVEAFWTLPYLSLTVDRTPPTLTAGSVTRDSEAAATVKFTSNEAGEYYYAVVESGADEPEIDTNVEWISCGTTQQTISLTDLSGAGAKDIYIAAKDKMGNVSAKLKIEIPVYVAPIYSISASPATLCFSSRQVGYTDKPKVTVTITNTGNQEIGSLSLQLKENSEYSFDLLSATRLDAGKTATATISPNTGLSAGTHVETLTITGRNNDSNVDVSTSVTLFFVVTEADHSHTYGEDWVTDTDSHWHACSCGDRADFAEHTASDWIVDEPATAVDHGRKHKECTACGYQMESASIPAGTTYPVTVSGSFADTTGEGNYYYDETVNISAGTRSGYTFTGWTSDDVVITNASSADASFTMPGKAVTVTANWKSNSSGGSSGGGGVSTYAITVESAKNGAVTVSPKSASKGSTVTLTVTPDKGYTLETLTVTDASGKEVKLTGKNGKYTFTMPAGKVKVEATFMEDNSMLNFFVDVPADAYYYDAVLWAAENGITGGVDDTHFAPNAPCTRAQIVTFLWRAAGSPEPESVSSFADVPADSYYAKAVAWAVENGITTGTGDGKFSPDATCTRAQAMAFIWRSQKSVAADDVNPFTDVAADAYYAGAVQWAVENGITNGSGDGTTFSPNANCTRAQIVTFLFRCLGE